MTEVLKDRFVVTFNSDGAPKLLMRASEASRLLNEKYPADAGWAMPLTITDAGFELPPVDGLGTPRAAKLFRLDLINPEGKVVRSAHKAIAITTNLQIETVETLLLTRLASRCGFLIETLDDEQIAQLVADGGQIQGVAPKAPANTPAPTGNNVVALPTTQKVPSTPDAPGSSSAPLVVESKPVTTSKARAPVNPDAPRPQQINQIATYARKLGREVSPPATGEEAVKLLEQLRLEWHNHARA